MSSLPVPALPFIQPAHAEFFDAARCIAERFGLPLLEDDAAPPPSPLPFRLCLDETGLRLEVLAAGRAEFGRHPLRVDFSGDRRFREPLRVADPLARALGLRAGSRPQVGDLSGGLGRDAWAIASLGCQVRVRERHPVIAALLEDGLRRAVASSIPMIARTAAGLAFEPGEGSALFEDPPEVLYFDPMFPERVKSALVKKEMRIFRALVGEDPDAEDVFKQALTSGCRRLVIKRPRHAPPLPGPPPAHCIESSRLRFDIYLAARPG